MEQVSGLYNPGFVGSQFHWWLGKLLTPKLGVTINLKDILKIEKIFRDGDTDIK